MNFIKKHIYFFVGVCVIFFVFLWIGLSLAFINKVSFSVVTFSVKNQSVPNLEKPILKGEFVSRDNNLGLLILSLEGNKISKSASESAVVFRFKEKGESEWKLERVYKSGLFDSQKNFTFGIPTISDSRNKIYDFEIYSSGNDENGQARFGNNGSFITGYQYPKSEIFRLNSRTLNFIKGKIISSFSDVDFLKKSMIFIVPLIFFLILMIVLKYVPSKSKIFENTRFIKVIKLAFILFVLTILLPENLHFLIFIFLWVGIVILFRIKSKVSFLIAFVLFSTWILLIYLNLQFLQEKLNLLSYLFLAFGSFQLLIEVKEELKDEKKKN